MRLMRRASPLAAAAVKGRERAEAPAGYGGRADRARAACLIRVRVVAGPIPDARRSAGNGPVSRFAGRRPIPVLLALFGARIDVAIGVARSAVTGGERPGADEDYADPQAPFSYTHGLVTDAERVCRRESIRTAPG